MSMTTITMANVLPHELVVNILSRLPVKSLSRFRCVSKPWKSFLHSDPNFIQMHLDHSINNYEHLMLTTDGCCFYSIAANNSNVSSLADEAVVTDYPFQTYGYWADVLGSCNGLLLINPNNDLLCIWNPSTKEFKELPDTPVEFPKSGVNVNVVGILYGFGYDKNIKDYKVVRIVLFNDNLHTEVKVYTLGSDSWRRVQDIPNYCVCVGLGGKLVNGSVHWVGKKFSSSYDKDNNKSSPDGTILSFNLEDEQYIEIQQPNYTDTVKFHMKVELLDGCLCVVCHYDIRIDVWVMKDYGVKESWIKLFTIAETPFIHDIRYMNLKPLKVTKNGEILLLMELEGVPFLRVNDPKHGTSKRFKILGMEDLDYFQAHTYVESLVSLNSGTFVGHEQAARRRKTDLQNPNKRKSPREWWRDGL